MTKAELIALSERLPADAFFLEHSRDREIIYIRKSYSRWMEILGIARSRIPNISACSCLDIGSSPFTFLLKSHFEKVRALDLSDALRPRCLAAGIDFQEGGVGALESSTAADKVDCVFFLEVLEHLHTDPIKVLKNIRAVLKPGGLLVLTTPNLMCLANRILMLRNRKLHHFTYPPFAIEDRAHGFGHDRVYMPEELQDYFRESGFKNIETLYQLNVDDLAHVHDTAPQRVKASLVRLSKLAFPSFRDGIIMLGRCP
jgi:SAM-dependent methyltransferase